MAIVKCPICDEPVEWNADHPFRPFCSERCKNIDLGAWASERYAIADDGDRGEESDSIDSKDDR